MSSIKKILLVCSSGMSTSILVKSMQKASIEENFPAEISSTSVAGIEDKLADIDALLVGPQIRHRFSKLKEVAEKANVPIELIPAQIYGLIDGKAALNLAVKMMRGED